MRIRGSLSLGWKSDCQVHLQSFWGQHINVINLNCLLSRVYKARYFPHSTFLRSPLGSRPSFTLHSIQCEGSFGERVGLKGGCCTVVFNLERLLVTSKNGISDCSDTGFYESFMG